MVGIGEVSRHIHEKPPIPGRTNSTAIEIYYDKHITPVTLGALNKHPKLKNLYFLQENAETGHRKHESNSIRCYY